MEWVYLALAIVFETMGTTCLKLSDGFSRLAPTLLILPTYIISFALLALAVKVIPISVAYAIWSAAGTAIIAFIGILLFGEPLTVLKLFFLALIVIGVVGLHLSERVAGGA